MIKPWLAVGVASIAAGLAFGVGYAQSDTDQQPDGGQARGGGHGAVRAACHDDLARFCPDVEPGGGRVFQCIRQHHDELSDGCKAALQSAHGGRRWRQDGSSGGPPDASPDAPPAPSAPPPG